MIKKITLQINKPLRAYLIGTIIKIKVDKYGTPLERYWRDRIKDAKIDGCVKVVKKKKRKGD